MENTELKIASHYSFESATLYVKCEEKNGSLYWYGDNSDNLKKVTTRTSRGCGRISKYVGNEWKKISKKAAAEILAKYGITAEQFIAYTNEEPELMSKLAAQKAEEERKELLDFFLSNPLTSIDAATEAEIEMSEMASKSEVTSATQDAVNTEVTEITAEDDGSNDDPDEDEVPAIGAAIDNNNQPELAVQVEEKLSPTLTTITVEREETKMAIAMPTIGAAKKGKAYFVDGMKMSKATTEVVIQSYVLMKLKDGEQATIEMDTRLTDEFKAITSSPYKGEFTVVYTNENGKPVEVATAEKQDIPADSVDTTPYHVEIKMYGNKSPMFGILCNGKYLSSKRGSSFSKSEADEWIIKTYQMRKQYPNMTIEVPEVVAALHLDSFACNPRIVRELNVTLTGFEMESEPTAEINERHINEYAIIYGTTPEALEVATNAEIQLANSNAELDENNVDDLDSAQNKATRVPPVQSRLPSGDITVESGAEAFALIAQYFPNGLDFDGIDYGYRGETHFCFFNGDAYMSVIAMSDEENRRIEILQIVAHQKNGMGLKEHYPLSVCIQPKNIDVKPLVKSSNVKKTSETKNKTATATEKKNAKKTSKKAVSPDKISRWIENAKINESGKYYIVPELTYQNFEANANWNPCFYIVTNENKLRRIGLKFAVELATLGQAIEISKGEMATLEK